MTTKKPGVFPFPYYGEGSATPVREKDGLNALLVFAAPLSSEAKKSIAASAPSPMRVTTGSTAQWLFLNAHGRVASKALTAWVKDVHASHPVALFFVGSDGKRGLWHADTVKSFGPKVRPIIDLLRKAGAKDHADWIAVSFLRSGAKTSFDDIRKLADEDPIGYVGDIGRRCLLAWPLVEALGPAALSEMGPYAELGFWACASISELVPDLAKHAAHLAALADACPAKRRPTAVQHLLVRSAFSMMRDQMPLMVVVERARRVPRLRAESFDAAMTVGRKAASFGPLTVGFLDFLVDGARVLGGPALAVAMAKPFLPATIAATPTTRDDHAASEELDRLYALEIALAKDLAKAPDAEVARELAKAPKPEPEEKPIKGATHPHLARLNAERLNVRYRGSLEPQTVVIELKGSSQPGKEGAHFRTMRDLIPFVEVGLAGAAVFAPELGEISVLEGPTKGEADRDARWKLQVRGVAPAFWAVALHFLAKSESYGSEIDLRKCPKHISIVGELPVDASSASATTEDVLGWLKKPGLAFLPFPEPPFAVAKAKGADTALVVKPARMTKQAKEFVESAYYKLGKMFEAYPTAKRVRLEHAVAGKTQVRLSWAGAPPPASMSRGPLLNVARRLHVKVGALTVVELG